MTPFARKVYRAVLSIPRGEVRTYKWVAKRAGCPKAYRAAGSILRKNPLPLVIPCHRVVKSDSRLGEYIFGAKMKKFILDLEKEITCPENRE